jgi:hypothetical protein
MNNYLFAGNTNNTSYLNTGSNSTFSNNIDFTQTKNLVPLCFEIFRKLLGPYIESQVRNYFLNDEWIKILYQNTTVTITDLLDPNCFLRVYDLDNMIKLFNIHWNNIFSKKTLNFLPLNLLNIVEFNLKKFSEAEFNLRETYLLIDLCETFLDTYNLNSIELEKLRYHTLELLNNEENFKQNNFGFLKKDSNVEMATYLDSTETKLKDYWKSENGGAVINIFNKYNS